jgi:hypothetical protein
VSYIRAFASLQQSEATQVNIEFERPPLSKFIHTFYISAARKCWSNAYLFNSVNISSTQQAKNRRDIETMLEATMGEVIDGFIPWREISRAYFQAREEPPKPVLPPVSFAPPQVHEFETDDEDSEEEDRPKVTLGEDVTLDDEDDDKVSVSTEDELQQKATETVALNL